jgi:hypothetical protein
MGKGKKGQACRWPADLRADWMLAGGMFVDVLRFVGSAGLPGLAAWLNRGYARCGPPPASGGGWSGCYRNSRMTWRVCCERADGYRL